MIRKYQSTEKTQEVTYQKFKRNQNTNINMKNVLLDINFLSWERIILLHNYLATVLFAAR